jgi:hypothetical protein
VVLVPVTVQASPSSGQITVDGTNYTGSVTQNWVAGSSHALGAPSPQAVATGTQLVWASWSNGSGTAAQTVTAPSAATTYTASFTTQYLVSTAASPSIGGTLTGSGYYDSGATAQISATANSGYTFTSFSGGASGTTTPISFTVTAPVTVVANFGSVAPSVTAAVTSVSAPTSSTVNMTITLTNHGSVSAYNAQIAAINSITNMLGSGTITLASGVPGPSPAVTLAPGQTTTVQLVFNWPSTVTKAQISFLLTSTDVTGNVSYPATQNIISYR